MSESRFDLVVIGAGINGAGIARDAAMRGWKALLVDKGDLASGTSSASTRLIHGGLRYLEHADFHLVRQSLNEREVLLRIAPHLIKPLPILIPIYRDSKLGRVAITVALSIYDLIARKGSLPRHRMLSSAEVLANVPGLNPHGLIAGALYFDAQVEFAERLVLENALAAREYGATVRTYVKVRGFQIENGRVCGLEFTDMIRGGETSVSTEAVVNAAGPWVDEVLSHAPSASKPLLGGTKGSHIIVKKFKGAPSIALYIEAKQDQRPIFVIPWNNNYLIGTTDIRFTGNLDDVRAGGAEIDYLMSETNRIFPDAGLDRASILFTYSGIRPLAFSNIGAESRITRRHFVREHENISGLFSIVGGKLTTYRRIAEETVDLIGRTTLGQPPHQCSTAMISLPGASTSDLNDFCSGFRVNSGLPPQVAERLLRIYGTRAEEIMAVALRAPAMQQVFDQETGAITAELVFAFENEFAQTLSDCLLRRTMVGLSSSRGLNAVMRAGEFARVYFGWSEERVESEVAQYRKFVETYLQGGLVSFDLDAKT